MSKESEETSLKYTAPALEKGLDIIEFLAGRSVPTKISEIALGVERSRGEIFRMIVVLEWRGVLEKTENGDAYEITDKLFSLRRKRSFAKQIAETALAKMEAFCRVTGLSCHLALRSGNEIIVILRVDHPENPNIAVPIGHRRDLVRSPSGRCILAYSDGPILKAAVDSDKVGLTQKEKTDLYENISKIRLDGYSILKDSLLAGVSGISAPIINQVTGSCNIALATTILQKVSIPSMAQAEIVKHLVRLANEISKDHFD